MTRRKTSLRGQYGKYTYFESLENPCIDGRKQIYLKCFLSKIDKGQNHHVQKMLKTGETMFRTTSIFLLSSLFISCGYTQKQGEKSSKIKVTEQKATSKYHDNDSGISGENFDQRSESDLSEILKQQNKRKQELQQILLSENQIEILAAQITELKRGSDKRDLKNKNQDERLDKLENDMKSKVSEDEVDEKIETVRNDLLDKLEIYEKNFNNALESINSDLTSLDLKMENHQNMFEDVGKLISSLSGRLDKTEAGSVQQQEMITKLSKKLTDIEDRLNAIQSDAQRKGEETDWVGVASDVGDVVKTIASVAEVAIPVIGSAIKIGAMVLPLLL